MSKIKKIYSREIIDSRGHPTIETEVHLSNYMGRASVPSGASTGTYEAIELRDGNKSRFFGKGVSKAVNIVNGIINSSLIGKSVINQFDIDQTMIKLDGTDNKSVLGANSILSVSLAAAKAAAKFKKMHLYQYIAELNGTPKKFCMPLPMINIINGGKHANNNIDIQEFMIQPVSAKNIKEAIRMGSEIFHTLGMILKNKNMNTTVGDEGGYAPYMKSNEEPLSLIKESVEISGYTLGKDIMLAIDCAASEFFNPKNKKYYLECEEKNFTSEELTDYLLHLTKKYPIISIEDGQSELDWNGFAYHTKILGKKIQVVGDDVFVTNSRLFKKGIHAGIANAILIKLNQIGSLTETIDTVKIAKKHGYNAIISHRSGETEDTTIADLAVGLSCDQIKTGSMSRSERTAKYNRLIRIEENIGDKIMFNSNNINKTT